MNIRPATRTTRNSSRRCSTSRRGGTPTGPVEPIAEVLDDPVLRRYHEGWGRDGDGGGDRRARRRARGRGLVPAVHRGRARLRLRRREDPGARPWRCSRCTGARASAARCFARRWCRRARTASRRSRSRSRSTTARRMMYQRVGFEKVGEQGDSWTMLVTSERSTPRACLGPRLRRIEGARTRPGPWSTGGARTRRPAMRHRPAIAQENGWRTRSTFASDRRTGSRARRAGTPGQAPITV